MHRVDPAMTRRARYLRANATETERTVWRRLSHRPRFTRQLFVGPYIVDLACHKARLAVELDGSHHLNSQRDAARTRFIESAGWTVLRFWNRDVMENPDGISEAIIQKVADCMAEGSD